MRCEHSSFVHSRANSKCTYMQALQRISWRMWHGRRCDQLRPLPHLPAPPPLHPPALPTTTPTSSAHHHTYQSFPTSSAHQLRPPAHSPAPPTSPLTRYSPIMSAMTRAVATTIGTAMAHQGMASGEETTLGFVSTTRV